jgi:hypothetical protein
MQRKSTDVKLRAFRWPRFIAQSSQMLFASCSYYGPPPPAEPVIVPYGPPPPPASTGRAYVATNAPKTNSCKHSFFILTSSLIVLVILP